MAKLEVKDNCPLNNFEKCKQWDCAWYILIWEYVVSNLGVY